MNRTRWSWLLVLLILYPVSSVRAQSSAQLLDRGVRAVQDLDYDTAAVVLRAALARTGADPLPDTARARALMYLGATEFFRDHRDSASAIFRRLLALDPRYRPDQLVFPPEVSSLFQDIRAGTRFVAVRVPATSQLEGPGGRLAMRLYATSLHEIVATITRPGLRGVSVRSLYAGSIGDSLELLWDARDSSGTVVDSGAYAIHIVSRGSGGRPDRLVEIPLTVRPVRPDTQPWPAPIADSLLLPEHGGPGHPGRALAGGFLAAAAVVMLPSLIDNGHTGSGARFGVAAASSLAGIVGFMRGRHADPIPANIAANQQLRAAWQQRADRVRDDNAARRGNVRIVVTAGAARVLIP